MTKMMSADFVTLHLAQAQAAPAAPGGLGGLGMLPTMGLFMVAMYFLMIAPQRKKQKEHDKMLKALSSGDEVITTGGVYGTITNVKDDRFVIRVGENQKIEIGKSFIHTVLKRSGEEQKPA